MTRRAATLLAVGALVAIGVAAYSNSFNAPFIFDDVPAIVENPAIRHGWPPGPILAGTRPVVDLTFALNCALDRFNVPGYHLVNLAIHILAALTLFGIIRRTLLQCRLPIADCRMMAEKDESTAQDAGRERISVHCSVITQHLAIGNRQSAIALILAFCAALIWMAHPLQTQAVTYITQRMESLMGLFYLLTLYALIRAADATADAETRRRGDTVRKGKPFLRVSASPRLRVFHWQAAAVLACALGMGCKQVMVTTPVALLLYDRTFLAGSFREALRRRWGLYLALAATWLIIARSALSAFSSQPASAGLAVPGLTPLAYARSEPGVILHYLRLAFWPGGLCLDYGWPIARTAAEIAPGAIVVGILLAATLWALVRRPKWGFAGAWFFLVLAPTSSFMPIQDLASEHRMYLPLAAVVTACVVAAWLFAGRLLRRTDESPESRRRRALVMTALLAFFAAAGLCSMTLRRNAQYRSESSIWADATRQRPKNPRAWNNLGRGCVVESRYDDAIGACNKALELAPDFSLAYNNRGLAYAGLGRLPEALGDYDRAIELNPHCDLFYNDRGVAYARSGRAAEALSDYNAALALNPGSAEAYNNRGNVLTQIGRSADALRDYDRAISLKTDFADAWYNRAIANSRLGRRDEALRDYTRVLELNPRNAAACNGRGKTLAGADRTAEAIRDFDRAIALNPRFADAYYNRGNARADAGRHSEAVQDYDQAIALNPDFAAAYNNRAVAYYEIKAYDKARADVKTFERLGGRPDPGFLKALQQAAGPAGRTGP